MDPRPWGEVKRDIEAGLDASPAGAAARARAEAEADEADEEARNRRPPPPCPIRPLRATRGSLAQAQEGAGDADPSRRGVS